MNSRGTRMTQRITGDMLASSDNVAAVPTAQAAAAGTQCKREVERLRERGTVRVIARENKQSNREKGVRPARGRTARLEECGTAARLCAATVPA
ncbi:hypothetical protein MTER_22910 [Mycolicibacter terrae]|uniref:Uncharacterized protein n=1 Tax=Mycolicibacter terrae TaxID=1788 RepID=A0AAD1HYR7_9MYCO|nr:hypothetical protein MTER_22910 [Mycolicibacter terrae]